jgi:hypothetical protein
MSTLTPKEVLQQTDTEAALSATLGPGQALHEFLSTLAATRYHMETAASPTPAVLAPSPIASLISRYFILTASSKRKLWVVNSPGIC